MNDIVRKLAKVAKIEEIIPIENADSICQYRIGGWKIVDGIGKYNVGDLVVYLEVDSWVPTEIAPFLSKGKDPKEFNGIKGERLKTIKLRGALSQGLILPITVLGDDFKYRCYFPPNRWLKNDIFVEEEEGADCTEYLGIQKWELPVNAQLAGQAKGNFPHFLRKTDEERIQNIKKQISESYENGEPFEVTLKLDGSSNTTFLYVGEHGICSRNIYLKSTLEENPGNKFVETAYETGLVDALYSYGKNIAVQSELMGPGIQGNREKLQKFDLFMFNVFNIDGQRYLAPFERYIVYEELTKRGYKGKHVPVVHSDFTLPSDNIDELLELANIKSLNHDIAEGIVLKSKSREFSFKIINNLFLLKEK